MKVFNREVVHPISYFHRYVDILTTLEIDPTWAPEGARDRSVFELKLLACRALGYVKGRRGRDFHVTLEGKAYAKEVRFTQAIQFMAEHQRRKETP